jgi:hypothetical protein
VFKYLLQYGRVWKKTSEKRRKEITQGKIIEGEVRGRLCDDVLCKLETGREIQDKGEKETKVPRS